MVVALSPVPGAQRRGQRQRYRAGGGAPRPSPRPVASLDGVSRAWGADWSHPPKPHVSDRRCGWRRAGTGSMLHSKQHVQCTNAPSSSRVGRLPSLSRDAVLKPFCRRRDRRDTFLVAPMPLSRLQQAERQAGEGVAAELRRSWRASAPNKMVPDRLATAGHPSHRAVRDGLLMGFLAILIVAPSPDRCKNRTRLTAGKHQHPRLIDRNHPP